MKALLLQDIQNDFLPGGALPVPRGDEVISIANQLMDRFEIIIATQDWHPPNHCSFAASHPGRRVGDTIEIAGLTQVLWPVHCLRDTHGADFAPGLDRDRFTRVHRKGDNPAIDSYSSFFDNGHSRSTGLAEWLDAQSVNVLYIAGLATDYCVKFTALDAVAIGYDTHVILDACRGIDLLAGDVHAAIERMKVARVNMVESRQLLENERAWPSLQRR